LGQSLPASLVTSIQLLADELGGPFKAALEGLVGGGPARQALKDIEAFLSEMQLGQDLADAFRRLQTVGMQFTPAMLDALQSVTRTSGGFLDNIIKSILHESGIPGYASGGIVPGPIGQPQLAVVHGGEQVIPAGNTYNLNIQTSAQYGDVRSDWALLRAWSGG
jgi:hypothetical protein